MSQVLRAFFNEKAPLWDALQEVPVEKLRALLLHLPIPQGATILDVGSGTGVLVPFLRELFAPALIVELDIAERMLAEARKKFGDEGIEYVWGDAATVVFERTFDAILCYSSFPHFEKKEETVAHLSQFLRELGILAIFHTQGRAGIHAIHALYEVTRTHLLPEGEVVAAMLERAGIRVFEVLDTEEAYLVAGIRA
ncbi:class I SAM-dependent methyltransferase [Candidatus Caldatribacterium sp. SIUC1]|uniref:class I SAM-dependent methyltransferase n=1 Tax=Candidatus Caldatribacterium sp. SIUC1 TaxID=3418365 RepID=UPI003F69170E